MTFGKFTMYKIYPYFGFQCNRLHRLRNNNRLRNQYDYVLMSQEVCLSVYAQKCL